MHEMVDKRAKQNVGSCQLSTSKIDESNYDIVSAGSKIATIRMFIQHKLGLAKPVLWIYSRYGTMKQFINTSLSV